MSCSADDDDVDYLVITILFLEVVDITTLETLPHRPNQHENSLEHKSAPLALIARGETSERVESKLIVQLESQKKSWQIFL
jgi:hypothetical protein